MIFLDLMKKVLQWTESAKKIEKVFFGSSADNTKMQKIINEYKHPANLLNLKPTKINPEIESTQHTKVTPPS